MAKQGGSPRSCSTEPYSQQRSSDSGGSAALDGWEDAGQHAHKRRRRAGLLSVRSNGQEPPTAEVVDLTLSDDEQQQQEQEHQEQQQQDSQKQVQQKVQQKAQQTQTPEREAPPSPAHYHHHQQQQQQQQQQQAPDGAKPACGLTAPAGEGGAGTATQGRTQELQPAVQATSPPRQVLAAAGTAATQHACDASDCVRLCLQLRQLAAGAASAAAHAPTSPPTSPMAQAPMPTASPAEEASNSVAERAALLQEVGGSGASICACSRAPLFTRDATWTGCFGLTSSMTLQIARLNQGRAALAQQMESISQMRAGEHGMQASPCHLHLPLRPCTAHPSTLGAMGSATEELVATQCELEQQRAAHAALQAQLEALHQEKAALEKEKAAALQGPPEDYVSREQYIADISAATTQVALAQQAAAAAAVAEREAAAGQQREAEATLKAARGELQAARQEREALRAAAEQAARDAQEAQEAHLHLQAAVEELQSQLAGEREARQRAEAQLTAQLAAAAAVRGQQLRPPASKAMPGSANRSDVSPAAAADGAAAPGQPAGSSMAASHRGPGEPRQDRATTPEKLPPTKLQLQQGGDNPLMALSRGADHSQVSQPAGRQSAPSMCPTRPGQLPPRSLHALRCSFWPGGMLIHAPLLRQMGAWYQEYLLGAEGVPAEARQLAAFHAESQALLVRGGGRPARHLLQKLQVRAVMRGAE